MIVAGIDVGSLTGKAVILKFEPGNQHEIIGSAIVPTSPIPAKTANNAYDNALEKTGLTRADVQFIIGTGYGRVRIPFANSNISEITCHGRGAHSLIESVRLIIDIGGQDSKVIRIDETGKLVDFAMNDKCAAGTGRFLEVMARALEVKLDDMGPISFRSKNPALITAQCSVFAETEVVSLIAEGKRVEDIVAGIHEAIASRIMSLVNRVGIVHDITISGGVAKNEGVVTAIEKKLGFEIKRLPMDPQLMGALGAALFAKDELIQKSKPKKRTLKKWDF
ncbi:MAG: acyl-CoA dehydratase activase [Candidatus Helarchaeales archaeon]